jgi:hypothetical protein
MDLAAALSILKPALPLLKKKVERSEWVIKQLKELGLEDDHLLRDFTGVYRYTLVEYAAVSQLESDLLELTLDLFRDQALVEGFRAAFEQGTFERLDNVADEAIQALVVGDRIRQSSIDAHAEIKRFAAIFLQLTRRTQTPGEVLTSLQIQEVHRSVYQMQSQLQSLSAIEQQLALLT